MTHYLDAVNAAIDDFETQHLLGTHQQDWKAMVELLADIRDTRQRLHQLEAVVEALCAAIMTDNRLELPALGLLAERHGGKRRTSWDHSRLAGVVARTYATDETSGELDPTLAEVSEAVTSHLLQFAHVDYWRAGVLRSAGIDPDGYATVERGRSTVQITRAGQP